MISPQETTTAIPTPVALSHISVPSRDLEASKAFYVDALGGDLVLDTPEIGRVQFGEFGVEFGRQDGGATPRGAEYPHYAFTVDAGEFVAVKQRIEAFGVHTHDPWTRAGKSYALMYFRDPSGNQFELFCPDARNAFPLRLGSRAGGVYAVDFPSLSYDRLRPPTTAVPAARPAGYNHMTLPVRDLQEGKRFWTEVLGGWVSLEHSAHITVVVGGAEVGISPESGGWTAPDAEYPHYTFRVQPEDLLPLKDRLAAYGVPTSDVWSRDGADARFYFRDPSGNLWELLCDAGYAGPLAGAAYRPDVAALNYDAWRLK
ncbi:MAG TPA: VOC family protein [Chloroflexota bacterium]|nr:VOC family protein [Chloroflexota bacterium]